MKGTVKRASFQGSFRSQPNKPFDPSSLPLISKVAKSEKAVMREGMTTMKVSTTWRYFQKASIPGSTSWWWNPTGMENNRNKRKDSLASESENTLPPMTFGMTVYQAI